MNKPQVDEDKACARLLLHKALQDKYKFIRGRFSNVPIQDLFMSRLERRKIKKEAKEKQKNKKKGKDSKVVKSEGDWNVEDVVKADNRNLSKGDDVDDDISGDEADENDLSGDETDNNEILDNVSGYLQTDNESNSDFEAKDLEDSGSDVKSSDNETKDFGTLVKPTPAIKSTVVETKVLKKEVNVKPKEIAKKIPPKEKVKKNPVKKQKELNKVKNFSEKILQKKLKKDCDSPAVENKIVDPFFITSTGENYMSVAEPRAPDEIKEEHQQGNRRLRRAVMFGLVPKPKQNNYYNEDNRSNKQNGYDKGNNFNSKFNDRKTFNNDFNDKRGFNNRNDRNIDDKPEKLHPSWEAKKKKSGILPFEGKKIVFD